MGKNVSAKLKTDMTTLGQETPHVIYKQSTGAKKSSIMRSLHKFCTKNA